MKIRQIIYNTYHNITCNLQSLIVITYNNLTGRFIYKTHFYNIHFYRIKHNIKNFAQPQQILKKETL